MNITDNFWPLIQKPETALQGYVNSLLTVVIIICAVVVLIEAGRRWYRVLVKGDRSGGARGSFSPLQKPATFFSRCC
jgi:hypothetical protein